MSILSRTSVMKVERGSFGVGVMRGLAALICWGGIGFGEVIAADKDGISEALVLGFESSQKAVKSGFTVREQHWGGDLPVNQPRAIVHQLFKGNEYWFWMSSAVPGAKVSVHVYDKDGKLVEDEVVKAGGTFAVRLTPKRTGSYYLLVEIEKSSEERTPWALIYAFR